jgi:hypothetical protein
VFVRYDCFLSGIRRNDCGEFICMVTSEEEWKKGKMTRTHQLIILLGAVVSLEACTGEQVPPPLPLAIHDAKPNTVRKVQIALRDRGYYAGAVDGYLGEQTGFGIQRFQVDQCQRVKPIIDRPLLVSLGIVSE